MERYKERRAKEWPIRKRNAHFGILLHFPKLNFIALTDAVARQYALQESRLFVTMMMRDRG